MNTENKDRLKGLFQEVNLDIPSVGFESRLMEQIHIASEKKEKKRNFLNILAIVGGIVGIIGIPALIFWKTGLFSSLHSQKELTTDFSLKMPEIPFDPFMLSMGLVVLLLLIGDTLIRRRIWEKKHKE